MNNLPKNLQNVEGPRKCWRRRCSWGLVKMRWTEVRPRSRPASAFQAYMNTTSQDRHRNTRRFIEAFTKTVASAHPSLVSPDPSRGPLLASLSGLSSTRRLGSSHCPQDSTCSLASSTSLRLDGTLAMPSPGGGKLLGNRRLPVRVACRGRTFQSSRA